MLGQRQAYLVHQFHKQCSPYNKLLLTLHGIAVAELCCHTNTELGSSFSSKDGWNIREDSICGNEFIITEYIECWMWRLYWFLSCSNWSIQASCVVQSNVFIITSSSNHSNKGCSDFHCLSVSHRVLGRPADGWFS